MKLHRIGNLFGVYILSVAERDEDIDLKIKHLLMDNSLPNHMPKTRRFVSYLSNFSEIHFLYHFQRVWKSILLIVRKTITFSFYFYTEDKSGGNHLLVELFFIRWLSIAFLATCIIWAYDRKTRGNLNMSPSERTHYISESSKNTKRSGDYQYTGNSSDLEPLLYRKLFCNNEVCF